MTSYVHIAHIHPVPDPIEPEDITDAVWHSVIDSYTKNTPKQDQEKDANDDE
jgi:hypothetical protein